ncbi:hypothetical protein B0T09DRAFT_347999 [Sordaria sp. MPI-SDFR-AT-0083]|nr:hypothetical protein B0T09DRAFT_347999 [Sordaria sp. MPI-SDFR-AT-0083]
MTQLTSFIPSLTFSIVLSRCFSIVPAGWSLDRFSLVVPSRPLDIPLCTPRWLVPSTYTCIRNSLLIRHPTPGPHGSSTVS